MANIGKRVVEIVLKATDDTTGAFSGLTKKIAALTKEFPALGVLAGVAFGKIIEGAKKLADSIVNAYKETIRLGASFDDLSKRTDMSVQSLSKWAYVAELGGSTLGDFEMAFIRLRKSMADAINGNQQAIDNFNTLGVAFKNADGTMRDVEDVMLDIGDALKRHGAASLQAAASQDVMGRSSAAFASTLRQGSAELRFQAAEAKAWGAEMSDSFIRKATEADDAALRLRTAWGKLKQEMIPALAGVTEQAGYLAIMLSGRLPEATQAAWEAEQEFRKNFRLFDEAKLNSGADAMIAAVDRARKQSVERMAAADKEIAELSAKIAESMIPDKDRSMLDIGSRLGEGQGDGLMLWEDYEEAARKLMTVQEEIAAYGLPDPLNAMKVAEATAAYEALVAEMEDAANAVEEMSDAQQAVVAGLNTLASGLGDVGGAAAEAFLIGESQALKLGSMIRNVLIKAIRDMIAEFIRAKVVMAGLRLLGLPFEQGGTVPGMAVGGRIPRAANGYAVPDGPRGMDSRLIAAMPGEEVINRNLSRRLERMVTAYEFGAAVSPFAMQAGGRGGGAVIQFNVARPVGVMDGLAYGEAAVIASRKYSEANL